ncbi:MAG TPA: type II toxin-antitoxin system VapC family toxin [Stellaceae bacterium]|nr:type II toxin-antitoxin system VapC family toxin [Stellaceae bacterium]
MFVDASAIVAILTREAEADLLVERLEQADAPITSAIAVFEAVLGICRKRQGDIDETTRDVTDFLSIANITLVPIGPEEAGTALDAFARYGKGRGHPAQLNLGDCFAYAVAKNRRTSLLFKGDDFTKTDVA